MKVYLKILTAVLLMVCCMPMACKKDDPYAETIVVVAPPVTSQPENKLIPVQMGTGKSKMTFTYTEDHSLSKIAYGDGTSTVLEFNAFGKPSQLLHYDGEELMYYTQLRLDNAGRISSAKTYSVADDTYQLIAMFNLTYTSDSQISTISYHNEHAIPITIEKRIYAENGNLIREQNSTGTETANYTYDDKNGLFKNVNYVWLFAIEEQNKLFLSDLNNLSTCDYPLANAGNQHITYTYNQDSYPDVITSQISGIKQSYRVTYKTLK